MEKTKIARHEYNALIAEMMKDSELKEIKKQYDFVKFSVQEGSTEALPVLMGLDLLIDVVVDFRNWMLENAVEIVEEVEGESN